VLANVAGRTWPGERGGAIVDADVIVIGGGAAGEAAGFQAPESGARAVLVERGLVGGECPFWACMPSKTLLNSAARRAGGADVSWEHASARRDWMISREQIDYPDDSGHVRRLESAGTRVIRGEARIVGPGEVEVAGGEGTLRADAIIVAAGSTPFVPPIPGIDEVPYWTSRDATSTRELPSTLVILGGGVVGVEMAQVFVRFGARVTLVEGGDRILSRDHPLTSAAVADQLVDEGLDLRTGVTASAVRAGGAGRIVELSDGSSVEGAELLVAVGRRPADLRALGVEEAGATLDERGTAMPDDQLRIADGLFVVGDAAGGLQFTHVADYEGGLAVRAALGRDDRADLRAVPKVTFTDPEAAAVGQTVDEARATGIDAFEVSRDFASTGKGQTIEGARGHLTAVVDGERGRLVGAFAACPGAGELIHEAVLAMKLDVPLHVLSDTIHAFPTSARVFGGVFQEAATRSAQSAG
jgi:pyruvate/2-oxoglutarate dehydrogenase complex dihydrolipoamide dehydrogenase (E3) component